MGTILRPEPKRYDDELLLLDTHIWLWYLHGQTERFSKPTLDLLRLANRAHRLAVCDVSVWEIGVKVAKGRLDVSFDLPIWMSRAERMPGISFLPLDRQALILSTMLPEGMRGDPADRMLVACAFLNRCPLVTKDRAIIDYARRQKMALWVIDAR